MTQSTAGGRFRESSIEALRERINLVDVVSQTVSLRKSGSRYMGKCPFHEDSSPSFLVDDKHYHCFGCKAHGDAIAFEMGRTGCTFPEAVEGLAQRFNIHLEYESEGKESEQERTLREQKKSLSHIMGEVTRAYAQYLWSLEGKVALDYLRARGFSDDSIKDWELGLAPKHSVLAGMARKRGWDLVHLQAAGLIRQREGTSEWYDFFRDRIMIPIRDERGLPVAFGGRVFREAAAGQNAGPKYLNSPETTLFQKSKTLFNFNRARHAIVQAGTVVIVEGYMDCLAIARAGIPNVVAVLGTALTSDHLRKLARITKRVVLCFDSDNAGREAARKAFETCFPLNLVELQFAAVPSGKDPDDFIREHGAQGFLSLIENSTSLSNWVCDYYLSQNISRESQLRKIKTDFVPIVLRNPDPGVREITLEMATVALGLSKISSLTGGASGDSTGRAGKPVPERPVPMGAEGPEANNTTAEGVQESSVFGEPFPVGSAEEAAFFLSVTHAQFSMLPERLRNVLRGEHSDEPMDEVVLAQWLSSGMSGELAQAFVAWSETLIQHEEDCALVDVAVAQIPRTNGVMQLRALGRLNPECLLEAGLEVWVRGVLEPSEKQGVAPKLRNISDLKDPANLPFVRMIVRDAKVSRARGTLAGMLSRSLAHIEISYLDQEIEQTTRELRGAVGGTDTDPQEAEALQSRLRKLASERVRRHRKFIHRVTS